MESQKKGKIKTCLHLHFPASLAKLSPDLAQGWEHIFVTWAIQGVGWGGGAGGLGGEKSVGGGHDLMDSKTSSALMQASPFHTGGGAKNGSEEEPFHFYQHLHSFRWTSDSPSIFYKLLGKQSFKSKFLANSLPSLLPKKILYLSLSATKKF